MSDSENPFASPSAEAAEEDLRRQDEEPLSTSSGAALVRWSLAYLLNMPVAFMFGWMGTNPSGHVGMCLGIALLIGLGGLLTYRSRALGQVLIRGHFLFALTQFYPILQMMAGMVAAGLIEVLGFEEPSMNGRDGLGPLPAIIATLIVGLQIAFASTAIGGLLRLITPREWWADWRTPVSVPEVIAPNR